MISCSFENGREALLRHVTVGVIVLNEKEEVLLVKRAAHLLRGNTYTIPGGFLDRDEDTRTAALRELHEETGYTGEIVSLFRINDNPNRPNEDRQNVDIIYIARIVKGAEKLNKEVTDIAWFKEKDLPSDEEFAFDHKESIILYYSYLKNPMVLPILG